MSVAAAGRVNVLCLAAPGGVRGAAAVGAALTGIPMPPSTPLTRRLRAEAHYPHTLRCQRRVVLDTA